MSILLTLAFGVVIVLVIATLRFFKLFINIYHGRKSPTFEMKRGIKCVKTLIVAGSGGHTSEILRVTQVLSDAYSPRHYIVAQTDEMSEMKINAMEKTKNGDNNYKISYIPRSREVLQSWSSSLFSTLYSCVVTFPMVWKDRPDLLLVNGPGTCIPICLAAFILTFLGIKTVKIIYTESLCRVKTMSLSGKILYYFADQFIVQWPDLTEKYPLTTYMGRVV